MADAQEDGHGHGRRLFPRHSDGSLDLVAFPSHTSIASHASSPPSASSAASPPGSSLHVPGRFLRRLTLRSRSSKKGTGNILPPTSEAEEDVSPGTDPVKTSPGFSPPSDPTSSHLPGDSLAAVPGAGSQGAAEIGLIDSHLVRALSSEASQALASPQAFWSAAHFHDRFRDRPTAATSGAMSAPEDAGTIKSPTVSEGGLAAHAADQEVDLAVAGPEAEPTTTLSAVIAAEEDARASSDTDQIGVALTWTDEASAPGPSQSRVSASVAPAPPHLAYPSFRRSVRIAHRTSTGFVATPDGSWAVAGAGPTIAEPLSAPGADTSVSSRPISMGGSTSTDIESEMALVRALPTPPFGSDGGGSLAASPKQDSALVLRTDSPEREDTFFHSPAPPPDPESDQSPRRLVDATKLRSVLQSEKERQLWASAVKEGHSPDQKKIRDEASLWARITAEIVLSPAAAEGHSQQDMVQGSRGNDEAIAREEQRYGRALDGHTAALPQPGPVPTDGTSADIASSVLEARSPSGSVDNAGDPSPDSVRADGADDDKASSEESLPEAMRSKIFRGKAKVFEATRVRLEKGTAVLEREEVGTPSSASPSRNQNYRETVPVPSRALSHTSHPSSTSHRSGHARYRSRHSHAGSNVSSGPKVETTVGDLLHFPTSSRPTERDREKTEKAAAPQAHELDVLTLDPVLRKALQGGFRPKVHPSTVAVSRTSSGRVLSPSLSPSSYHSQGKTSRSPYAYAGPSSPAQSDLSLSQVAEEIARSPPLRAKVEPHMMIARPSGHHARSRRSSLRSITSLPVSATGSGGPCSSVGGSGRPEGGLGRQPGPPSSWTNAMGTMSVGIGARLAPPPRAPLHGGPVRPRVTTILPGPAKAATSASSMRPRSASTGAPGQPSVAPASTAGESATTAPPVLRTEQTPPSSAPPPKQT